MASGNAASLNSLLKAFSIIPIYKILNNLKNSYLHFIKRGKKQNIIL